MEAEGTTVDAPKDDEPYSPALFMLPMEVGSEPLFNPMQYKVAPTPVTDAFLDK